MDILRLKSKILSYLNLLISFLLESSTPKQKEIILDVLDFFILIGDNIIERFFCKVETLSRKWYHIILNGDHIIFYS